MSSLFPRRRGGAMDPAGLATPPGSIPPGPLNLPPPDYMGRPMQTDSGLPMSSLGNDGPQMPMAPSPREGGREALLATALGALFGGARGAAVAGTGYYGGAQDAAQQQYVRQMQQYRQGQTDRQNAFENDAKMADYGLRAANLRLDEQGLDLRRQAQKTTDDSQRESHRAAFVKNLLSIAPETRGQFLAMARSSGELDRLGFGPDAEQSLGAIQPYEAPHDPAGLLSTLARMDPQSQIDARKTLAPRAGFYGLSPDSVLNMPALSNQLPHEQTSEGRQRNIQTREYEQMQKVYYDPKYPPSVRAAAAAHMEQLGKQIGAEGLGPLVPVGQPDPMIAASGIDEATRARMAIAKQQQDQTLRHQQVMERLTAMGLKLRASADARAEARAQRDEKRQAFSAADSLKAADEATAINDRMESVVTQMEDAQARLRELGVLDEAGKPVPGARVKSSGILGLGAFDHSTEVKALQRTLSQGAVKLQNLKTLFNRASNRAYR